MPNQDSTADGITNQCFYHSDIELFWPMSEISSCCFSFFFKGVWQRICGVRFSIGCSTNIYIHCSHIPIYAKEHLTIFLGVLFAQTSFWWFDLCPIQLITIYFSGSCTFHIDTRFEYCVELIHDFLYTVIVFFAFVYTNRSVSFLKVIFKLCRIQHA